MSEQTDRQPWLSRDACVQIANAPIRLRARRSGSSWNLTYLPGRSLAGVTCIELDRFLIDAAVVIRPPHSAAKIVYE